MALNPKQWKFTACVAHLLLFYVAKGYHPRLAYALRSKEEAIRLGFENSNHTRYLAVDIDLFDEHGNYITDDQGHREGAAYWKTLDKDARWGGDITKGKSKGDFNHYSFEHDGVI